jgi:hypothetical protein
MTEPGQEPPSKPRIVQIAGPIAVAITALALGGFILGYGALSLFNGVATLFAAGEPVGIRVVSDSYSRNAADITGEYVRDGETT